MAVFFYGDVGNHAVSIMCFFELFFLRMETVEKVKVMWLCGKALFWLSWTLFSGHTPISSKRSALFVSLFHVEHKTAESAQRFGNQILPKQDYPPVNQHTWKITMFNIGKFTIYKWPLSLAKVNHQRVHIFGTGRFKCGAPILISLQSILQL